MTPALLFVHGFGCDRDNWLPQVEALSPAFEVATLDLPVVLVGHSMGCRVVLEALRMSPSGIAGLALIDGSATGRDHAPRLLRLLDERLRTLGMRASLRANAEEMFTADSPAALREAAVATALRLDPVFAENLFRALAQWDAVEALEPVVSARLPVLSIQATTLGPDMRRRSLQPDETSPWGLLVRRLVAHACLRDIPGVGHFVHLEAADAVNDELAAFVRRLPAEEAGEGKGTGRGSQSP